MIKIISFDLDGTLVDMKTFDDVLWFEEIPKLYAEQYSLTFEAAYKIVTDKYNKKSFSHPDWYRPSYWFKMFKLRKPHQEVLKELSKGVRVYPDVTPLLRDLSKKYKLIVITHSPKELIELKVEAENLKKYFFKIYSTIDDFNLVKKSGDVFQQILAKLKIKPEEMIHAGDDKEFDYKAAKKAGIQAFLLDRNSKEKGRFVIHKLTELKQKIKEIEK